VNEVVKKTQEKRRRRARYAAENVPGHILAELSDYFRFEDIGPPAVVPEPRAGTTSLEPKAPCWGPGANPDLMSAVYKRLCLAQQYMTRNIFNVLRVRYGIVMPADEHQRKVALEDSHTPETAAVIDHAEALYARVRPRVVIETHRDREWRRMLAKEVRIFGEVLE
jgi:hypothetical protein